MGRKKEGVHALCTCFAHLSTVLSLASDEAVHTNGLSEEPRCIIEEEAGEEGRGGLMQYHDSTLDP